MGTDAGPGTPPTPPPKHYGNTGTVFAKRYGRWTYGIWVAKPPSPGITAEQVQAHSADLRRLAHDPWLPSELVGALAVSDEASRCASPAGASLASGEVKSLQASRRRGPR